MTCISESNSRLGCPNLELGTTTTDFQKPIPFWDTFHFGMGGDPIPNRNIPIRIGPQSIPFRNGTNSGMGRNLSIIVYETDPISPNLAETANVTNCVITYACKGSATYKIEKKQEQDFTLR